MLTVYENIGVSGTLHKKARLSLNSIVLIIMNLESVDTFSRNYYSYNFVI